jgi:2-phosphoglycolate phosphatase
MGGAMPKLIIFDLDGTLVDSFAGIHHALDLALNDLDGPTRDLEWVRRHVGRGVKALMADAAGGLDEEELLSRFRVHYDRSVVEMSTPFPGVDSMLAAVSKTHRLAIASNKPLRWVHQLVHHLGWESGIAAMVAPESVNGVRKPDPAMVLALFERLGRRSEEALMVGDMPIDAETGRSAGIPVVGVTTGIADRQALLDAGCVAVLDSAAALPSWLERHRLTD